MPQIQRLRSWQWEDDISWADFLIKKGWAVWSISLINVSTILFNPPNFCLNYYFSSINHFMLVILFKRLFLLRYLKFCIHSIRLIEGRKWHAGIAFWFIFVSKNNFQLAPHAIVIVLIFHNYYLRMYGKMHIAFYDAHSNSLNCHLDTANTCCAGHNSAFT